MIRIFPVNRNSRVRLFTLLFVMAALVYFNPYQCTALLNRAPLLYYYFQGGKLPLDRAMITPASLARAQQLHEVYRTGFY